MSTTWRTRLPVALIRDVAAMAGAVAIIGVSLGALATSVGVPRWLVVVMSATVFAGGSEFALVGITAAGGSAVAAAAACLILNARHLPYGWAVAGYLGRGVIRRLVGSQLIVDESVAFALAQEDRSARTKAFWLSGCALYLSWVGGVFAGATLGRGIGDPDVFGLDAAFPAALLALLVPHVRRRPGGRVALAAAILALAAVPFTPAGVPVLVAMVGVAAAAPVPRFGKGKPA